MVLTRFFLSHTIRGANSPESLERFLIVLIQYVFEGESVNEELNLILDEIIVDFFSDLLLNLITGNRAGIVRNAELFPLISLIVRIRNNF
jgi:hypothetical protein